MAKITMEGGGAGGGISGSGAAGQVAFFTGTDSIDSDSLLLYDDTADVLTVGASTDGAARLNVQGFGAGASATGKALSVADDNGLEVFIVADSGKIYANATKADESLSGNVIIGDILTGANSTTIFNSVIIGPGAAENATGGGTSVIIGKDSFKRRGFGSQVVNNPTDCIAIGSGAKSGNPTNTTQNEIVIGAGSLGNGSNTTVIGNGFTTNTYLHGGTTVNSLEIIASGITITGNIAIQDAINGTRIGTTTTQKLALWNKTPIVQPTTAISGATIASPGAGNAIKTDDTFGGYTLAQVVQALINVGILQ
ncbi:MAG: hypothetical protein ACR2K1_04510 [Saprospiraceae bacterium]